MFHLKDGLYFEREENPDGIGHVRIMKRQSAADGAPILFDMLVHESQWISLIAAMSVSGEQASHVWASQFHRGIGGGV